MHSPARSSRLGRHAEFSFELEAKERSFVFSAQTGAELQLWLQASPPPDLRLISA